MEARKYVICTQAKLLGWKSVESVPGLVEDYLQNKLILDDFVTQISPFDDINKAFHDMGDGNKYILVLSFLFVAFQPPHRSESLSRGTLKIVEVVFDGYISAIALYLPLIGLFMPV